MSDVVLGLDQGTSSTRCFVVDHELQVLAEASRPVDSSFPRTGWVEQDPGEILESAVSAAREAVDRARVGWESVRAVGIDNQTETFVLWDRRTGEPVYPAIVWQDRRTAERCDRLRDEGHEPLVRSRTGLELDPSFSATKLGWVLDEVDGARRSAEAGRLAFGDVASWLIWRLSDGEHLTEPSNASRSMLMNLSTLEWDQELLDLFVIPGSMLPEIRPTASVFGKADASVLGADVALAGALGDQQAALFGQQCWSPGMTKLTLGTGAFVWANAGPAPPTPPDGILGTCAWQLDGETAYALEGFVPVAGAAVAWLMDLGILSDPASSAELASTVEGDEVWFVPALTGLGAPRWDPRARGALLGLTRGTSRAAMVRAALDGVTHQVADAVDAMRNGIPGGLAALRVDGGMAANDWLLQRLADLLAVPVERPRNTEATGIGAASVAGLSVGFWSSPQELAERWSLDRAFEPGMDAGERDRLRSRWAEAVSVAQGWQ
ncbi:MAG: FGGY family carbohydrate kinase [Actinomycetota bacterium]